MAFAQGSTGYSLKDILKIVSEWDILTHYFGITELPCMINSPLRRDKFPSFRLSINEKGHIRFYDFGSKQGGGLFNLLMEFWNLSFKDTVEKISRDLPYIKRDNNHIIDNTWKPTYTKKVYSSSTDIKVKVREWRDYDLEYWGKYGITKEWLEFGQIYPISHIILIKGAESTTLKTSKYAYAYVEFKDGKTTMKIYQPFNTKYKWFSKHDDSIWDLWNQLPEEGERLIITSSRKDALCLWANTGIPSTGLQGEGYLPKEHVVEELKQRFKHIYLLYDNDFDKEENYGRQYGANIANMYGLVQLEIPSEAKAKDPSDLCAKYGKDILRQLIYFLIKRYESNSF